MYFLNYDQLVALFEKTKSTEGRMIAVCIINTFL